MGLRHSLLSLYRLAKEVQALLGLYTDNSDPIFNAVIDALYNNDEKAVLGGMLTGLIGLTTDWEQNYPEAIGMQGNQVQTYDNTTYDNTTLDDDLDERDE